MADDLKSSAAVWGDNPQSTGDSPPAYCGVPSESGNSENREQTIVPAQSVTRRAIPRAPYDPLRRLAALSNIQFRKYNITDGTLSPDKISLTVKHSDLYAHPQHLLPFILEQAYLPPHPTLRIVGSHCGDRIDFDIKVNLTHLLDLQHPKWRFSSAQVTPIQSSANSVAYSKDDPTVPTRIATSIKQFCQDRSENKSYTLRRTVEGLPTENLAGQVRNLAASVKYRGLIRIEFTDEQSRVIVHKQPSSWFSNMLRLHAEKHYQVVETVWQVWDGSESGVQSVADMGLRAGHEWWQSWAGTIRNAMIAKYRGNVGIEDWIETKMGRLEPEPRVEWGRDHNA